MRVGDGSRRTEEIVKNSQIAPLNAIIIIIIIIFFTYHGILTYSVAIFRIETHGSASMRLWVHVCGLMSTGLQIWFHIKTKYHAQRSGTKIIDIIEYTLKQNQKWARHKARIKGSTWTKCCAQRQPRRGKRSWGRSSRSVQDIAWKEGTTWYRKTTEDNGRH